MARPLGRIGVAILASSASALASFLPGVPDRGTSARVSAQQAVHAAGGAAADDEPAAVDYSGLAAADPLMRARAVAALGDARVVAQLAPAANGGPRDAGRALAAIRSASWLADPGLALGPLIRLMNGRDPDLAPAAAQAACEIALGFVERSQLPESVTAEKLAAWIKDLSAVELSSRVRADIRLAAVRAAALLGAARERL